MSKSDRTVTASVSEERILLADSDGSKIVLDEKGVSALDLLLMAAAGCSGATLRALFKRDGIATEKCEIKVTGVRAEQSPWAFKRLDLVYNVICESLTADKLEHYLKITERMCPVVQSLNSEIKYTYNLNS